MVVLENMPELSCVHQLQQSSSQAEIWKSVSEKTYDMSVRPHPSVCWHFNMFTIFSWIHGCVSLTIYIFPWDKRDLKKLTKLGGCDS